MNRVTFTNSRGLNLVGYLYPASPDTVIIMCHGFASDQHAVRFPTAARSFNALGFSAISFDFSGCGESADDLLTLDKQIDDLGSAITYIKSQGYTKLAFFGHSLGCLIGLKCNAPDFCTMVLLGAATGAMDFTGPEHHTPDQLREIEDKGYFTIYKDKGYRSEIRVDHQLNLDFAAINQAQLLKPVTCPVLIIHGNQGATELALYQRSITAMNYLSKESRLATIAGASHGFYKHYDKVLELVNEWFFKVFKGLGI
ncbi:MAG TPA: alpha/beta hydrolase [Bacillota bacterium]|nr:alpha/beta hydrolase [Bacillota bacterium]